MRCALPALLAVLLLAGCGRSDDRATIRAATERFYTAYEADDGVSACAALSSDTRKALEREESEPCAEAIGSIDLDGGAVAKVRVSLTNAKVDLITGETLFFSEQKAGWRITALGCRVTESPTDTPLDCELEA